MQALLSSETSANSYQITGRHIPEYCGNLSVLQYELQWIRWLSSSGRWHRVALIRTDVSEDRIASICRVHECEQVTERSCKLLKMEAIRSSETSVLIRATRCHLPDDDNHHSHRRGNLKSYRKNFICNVLGSAFIFFYSEIFVSSNVKCSSLQVSPPEILGATEVMHLQPEHITDKTVILQQMLEMLFSV
jgi:hypothetical protein